MKNKFRDQFLVGTTTFVLSCPLSLNILVPLKFKCQKYISSPPEASSARPYLYTYYFNLKDLNKTLFSPPKQGKNVF